MTGRFVDFYALLDVASDASSDAVRAAVARQRQACEAYQATGGPADRKTTEDRIHDIDLAELVLLDPEQRADYDEEWRERRNGHGAAAPPQAALPGAPPAPAGNGTVAPEAQPTPPLPPPVPFAPPAPSGQELPPAHPTVVPDADQQSLPGVPRAQQAPELRALPDVPFAPPGPDQQPPGAPAPGAHQAPPGAQQAPGTQAPGAHEAAGAQAPPTPAPGAHEAAGAHQASPGAQQAQHAAPATAQQPSSQPATRHQPAVPPQHDTADSTEPEDDWIAQARAALHAGDSARAIDSYHYAIMLHPHEIGLHHELGQAYVVAGNYEQALGAFETAARLAPQVPDYRVAVGSALVHLARPGEAIGVLEQVVAEVPTEPRYRAELAQALHDTCVHEMTALTNGLVCITTGDQAQLVERLTGRALSLLDPADTSQLAEDIREKHRLAQLATQRVWRPPLPWWLMISFTVVITLGFALFVVWWSAPIVLAVLGGLAFLLGLQPTYWHVAREAKSANLLY